MSDDVLIHQTAPASPNFRTELAEQLAALVPEAIADGKIDVTKLQELLADDVADASERFGLFWPGKKRALRAAQEPTTATLRPDFDESKDWDTTKNVFIEGDNLEVLKILQKHYHNKIKMIYIDPPYNTGKDFVYPDNYKEGLDTYLEWTKQVTEGGKKVSTNSETEGRYHSNWLNMMYPRLKLARNLLTDDGVIFISVDDNEVGNLRKLCDLVFGEGNFCALIPWQSRLSMQNDTDLSINHEYIMVFAKRRRLENRRLKESNMSEWYKKDSFVFRPLPLDPERFDNPDNDPRGPWKADPFDAPNVRPNLTYPITNPVTGEQHLPPDGRCWRMTPERFASAFQDNRIIFGRRGTGRPQMKSFYNEKKDFGSIDNSWFSGDKIGTSTAATQELQSLFDGSAPFDTPKPTSLLMKLLSLGFVEKEDIVLDFFAGSGTTAHAVMKLNAEDGGNRRWITIQLPEPTPDGSNAQNAGYETIADIARERIQRAGDKIISENGLTLESRETPLDIGFRAYELTDSNFNKWQLSSNVEPDRLELNLLELRGSSSDDDATPDDLPTEILLKQGYSLTEHIEPVNIDGLDVRSVGHGLVLAYLNEHVKPTLDQLRAVVAEDPAKIIVVEDAFQGDDELKTNIAQLCNSKNIEFWTA